MPLPWMALPLLWTLAPPSVAAVDRQNSKRRNLIMRSNRSVAALSACSLILAAGAAASAAGVNWDGNWDGNVVRAPDARVIGQRVIPVEGSSATVMTWTEVGADGASQPYFAISLDG